MYSLNNDNPESVSFPIIDCHYDRILKSFTSFSNPKNLNKSATSLPLLREGNVQGAMFAVPGMKKFLFNHYIKKWFKLVTNPKNYLFQIHNYDDFQKAQNENKIGAILSCEGASCFPTDFKLLNNIISQGLKVLSLVWKMRNQYTASWYTLKTAEQPRLGLTEDGFALLKRTQTSKIIIDVSHLSVDGFWDIINQSKKPIIATHSNCRALKDHRRNLDDDQIKALADCGGVIGINFWTNVLDIHPRNKFKDLGFDIIKRHMDHIKSLVGVDYIAMGSDFDGAVTPYCVHNASSYPNLFAYLLKNGYDENELTKISHANILRVCKEVW